MEVHINMNIQPGCAGAVLKGDKIELIITDEVEEDSSIYLHTDLVGLREIQGAIQSILELTDALS